MMRKTYKSKKDTIGGLDHRDMLSTVDEKSSAFDAFYIHNIKQTKRELSSIGSTVGSSISNHHGVASNRVRKRKYVKRVVKEIEVQPRASVGTSVFLTPEKSIRVNKPLDLFDQLLNSSPVWPDAKNTVKEDPFDKLLDEKKTKATLSPKAYTKKKPRRVKQFNYGSKPDTDKENSQTCDNTPQNVTDIKSHELQIEKEAVSSPNMDDSIEKFVKNLSLLNNIKQRTSIGPMKKSYKNRLTRKIYSPRLTSQRSPLSSTPMNNKQRSKSIFQFSPITMTQLDDSTGCISNIANEENEELVAENKSIILVPKNLNPSKNSNKSQSSDTHSENKNVTQKTSKPMFSSGEMESLHQEKYESITQNKEKDFIETRDTLQTSELEPFVGFNHDVSDSIRNTSMIIPLTYKKSSKSNSQKSIDVSTGDNALQRKSSLKSVNLEIINDDAIEANEKQDLVSQKEEIEYFCDTYPSCISAKVSGQNYDSNYELTEPSEPFLGFKKDDIDIVNDCSVNSEPHSLKDEDSITGHDDTKMKSCTLKNNGHSSNNSESDEDYTCKDSLNSTDTEKESMYDTCNSDQSSIADESKDMIEEPVVALERLNDSVFKKYYDRMVLNISCWLDKGNENREHNKEPVDASESLENSVTEKLYNETSDTVSQNESMETSNENSGKENSDLSDNLEKSNHESIDDLENESVGNSDEENSVSFISFKTDQDLDNSKSSSEKLNHTEISNCTEYEDNLDVDDNEELIPNDTIYNEADTTATTNYEQRCFITTRRRKNVEENLSCIVLEDNNSSVSNSDCDTTMLSNKCDTTETHYQDNDLAVSALSSTMSGLDPEDINMDNKKDTNKVDPNNVNKNIDLNDTRSICDNDDRTSFITTRKSSKLPRISEKPCHETTLDTDMKPIVLQPGKKWERSLSIYRRITMANENFDQSILEEDHHMKGKKYRESVISVMEMQDCKGTPQNDSIQSRRNTITCKPSRSTIRIVKDNSSSRISLSSTSTDLDELQGFLEDCDDTIIELSKLSIDENEVTVLEKFDDQRRELATAREYVLRRCNQTEPLLFDECYPDSLLKNCRKIGEGVYGEVYLWRAPDGRARVMKVVPIAGSVRVNGECQKDFHEIISEIVIAMELSALRAPIAEIECHFDEGNDVEQLDLHAVENATDVFNQVLKVRCVFGSYPSRLLDLWDLYDECKGSENDNPAALPPDQQYIVLELANAGEDLESFQFNTAEQAYALLLQVAFGLAVGEEAFQFEHRDLHWGNVLIAPTEQKYATFILRGRSHRIPRRGVAATIIDYSLSRVSLPVGGAPCALYNDLGQDQSLFGAIGDYQFEIYRLMRDKLGNDWKSFEPYTNVLWLHYLVDKMITSLRYKRPNVKVHKQYIAKLKAIKDRVLTYGSAVQFVLTDQEF